VRAFPLALVLALVVTAAASARNPRLEKLTPRATDTALAKSSVLRANDLGGGWTVRPLPPDDDSPPDCKSQDYSAFTITGQAQTRFVNQQGATVLSRVEVYPSHRQVLGDFAVDAQPGIAACEGRAIRKEVAKQVKGATVTLESARSLAAPAVGEKSIAFQVVLRVKSKTGVLRLYIDLIGFVRDRTAASIVVFAPGLPPKGNDVLARTVDARLQRAA
jgi:hypothetical protein